MALEYTPDGLWSRIRDDQRANERRLAVYDSLRRRYTSPFYKGEQGSLEEESDEIQYDPEAHAYEFVSWIVPQLVYGTPAVRIRSRMADPRDPAHMEARAIQHAVNQWARDCELRTTLDQIAPDPLFAFGAALVSQEPNPLWYGVHDTGSTWPVVKRISPRNFGRDPQALTLEDCAYFWHRTVLEREDLIALAEDADEEAGWDLEAIRALPEGTYTAEYRPPDAEEDSASQREEVQLIEMWVRGYELEESEGPDAGFHGTWFTVACVSTGTGASRKDQAKFVRKPRPAYCDRTGPYAVCEVLRVPDEPWGLAPLVAQEGQTREVNRHARAMSRSADNYKQMIVTSAGDQDFGEWVKSGKHETVFQLKEANGLKVSDLVQSFAVGGVTGEMLNHFAIAKERWRRTAGMGEAQSGNAPDVTATAVAVAAGDAQIRVERIKEMWSRFVAAIYRKVAFYFATDETVELQLDQRSMQELMPSVPVEGTAVFQGGGMTAREFGSLNLEIDPLTLERTTEQTVQQRILQAHQLKLAAVPMIAQLPLPAVWEKMFNQLGEAFNLPGLGQDMRELAEASAMLMMQNPQPMQAPRETSYPSVSQGGGKPQGGPASTPSQNRTPGMSSGVSQPRPLAGAQQNVGVA